MTRREGDNADGGSKQARVVYVVDDDETEEYVEECGLSGSRRVGRALGYLGVLLLRRRR